MDKNKSSEPYEIVVYPDPRLHQKSETVEVVNYEIRAILDRMLLTIHKDDGLGLSGVQVGVMKRIVVIDIDGAYELAYKDTDRKIPPKLHGGVPLFLVNPEIIEKSEEKYTINEGCMSIPGVYIDMERAAKVKVKYLDYNGKEQTITAEKSTLSACLQHEIDHTNGKLTIDSLSPLKRSMQLKKAEKYLKAVKRHQENNSQD